MKRNIKPAPFSSVITFLSFLRIFWIGWRYLSDYKIIQNQPGEESSDFTIITLKNSWSPRDPRDTRDPRDSRDTHKMAFYRSQKSFELGLVQLVVHLLNLRDENPPKTWSLMVSSSW